MQIKCELPILIDNFGFIFKKCGLCKANGANMGCQLCDRRYHFGCGFTRGCVFLLTANSARSYCWFCVKNIPELSEMNAVSNGRQQEEEGFDQGNGNMHTAPGTRGGAVGGAIPRRRATMIPPASQPQNEDANGSVSNIVGEAADAAIPAINNEGQSNQNVGTNNAAAVGNDQLHAIIKAEEPEPNENIGINEAAIGIGLPEGPLHANIEAEEQTPNGNIGNNDADSFHSEIFDEFIKYEPEEPSLAVDAIKTEEPLLAVDAIKVEEPLLAVDAIKAEEPNPNENIGINQAAIGIGLPGGPLHVNIKAEEQKPNGNNDGDPLHSAIVDEFIKYEPEEPLVAIKEDPGNDIIEEMSFELVLAIPPINPPDNIQEDVAVDPLSININAAGSNSNIIEISDGEDEDDEPEITAEYSLLG